MSTHGCESVGKGCRGHGAVRCNHTGVEDAACCGGASDNHGGIESGQHVSRGAHQPAMTSPGSRKHAGGVIQVTIDVIDEVAVA